MLRARGSPVSDGGRGLKLVQVPCAAALAVGSPVSDGGRGLKQQEIGMKVFVWAVRPSAMAGVD